MYYDLDDLRDGDPDAYDAVKTWMETGKCTVGWVIFVDGVRVC
jgi:hypothetical protein